LYDPYRAIEEDLPHVTLVRTRLPKGHAWWVPSEDAIVVDDRLDQAQERTAGAHEYEHAAAGDVAVDLIFFSRKQEARARRRADRKLIRLPDFVDALLWCRNDQELAQELVVTPDVLERWWGRLTPAQRGRVDELLWDAERDLGA
jgi:hypothetical protein